MLSLCEYYDLYGLPPQVLSFSLYVAHSLKGNYFLNGPFLFCLLFTPFPSVWLTEYFFFSTKIDND